MARFSNPNQIRICEEVGRGAFGVVYRAVALESGHDVAVKQIDLDHELADILEVSKEIQILSECQLPQITKYFGCVVNGPKLWVIMEFIDGGLLYELLQDGKITDENLVVYITREMLLALSYLHGQGKIHRDFKSQNVLLTLDGLVKLTDFGVSTQLFSSFSRRNTVVGTPYWMAPEVIANSSGGHTFQADVWSLGCCIFEICTGKPPLQDRFSPMQALRTISAFEKDMDLWDLVDEELLFGFLPSLRHFLCQCLIVDPTKRPSTSDLLNSTLFKNIDLEAAKLSLSRRVTNNAGYYKTKSQHISYEQPDANFDGSKESDGVVFDFSTIKVSEKNLRVFTPPNLRHTLSHFESPMQPYTPRDLNNQRLQSMKQEFQKASEKSLSKLKQRTIILTTQFHQLAALNESMLQAFIPVQTTDVSHPKLLFGQHFKNILRELNKQPTSSTRANLLRSFIPSNLATTIIDVKPGRIVSETPMDEVERSLLSSWVESSMNPEHSIDLERESIVN